MSNLLPGYKEQLGRRATRLVAEHEARPRRLRSRSTPGRPGARRRHLGLGVLLAAVAVSGGAYASQGLWQPVMGDEQRGHARATDSPLPPDLLERYAVLRRPQTETDRGLGSRDALRWQSRGLIHTAGVRRVGTGRKDEAIVLIPFAKKRATPAEADTTRTLCLWMQDPAEAGGMACADAATVAGRGLWGAAVDQPQLTAAERRRLRTYMKTAMRQKRDRNGTAIRLPSWSIKRGVAHIRGLVPDGVDRVRVGPPGHEVTVAVRENLFQAEQPEQYMAPSVWLDGDGKVIPQPSPPSRPRPQPRPRPR